MFDKDAGGVAGVQHSANGTQRCLDLQKVLCAGRPLPSASAAGEPHPHGLIGGVLPSRQR